ncbi:DUF500-domain-containing protein [Ascobolus immersus RN42]|uniref:DUF500-domain-containing protein n=1 Tax=Ascobolus immersus RN42 TaxID=1160509 RepID=A0A3N4IBB9_ASCIM|nr:DUF500-domain-containing protein [Ascobolus immersus RN42]
MGVGLHNPLPANLYSECRKAAEILKKFVDPRASFGAEKVIPPSVLQNAKRLAILTVVKGGFLVSARVGSGLVVAKLPDGTWSAPSALGTAGIGFGGQIGAELTDFVMILNDNNAVRTFSEAGSVTLGGNVSVAAGPIGKNAEASGAASLRSVAGIFSYSSTKGLFAGVSLEGSVIIERKDANKKFYNAAISAKALLSGTVPPPPAADALYQILDSRIFKSNSIVSDYIVDPNENDPYNPHLAPGGFNRSPTAPISRQASGRMAAIGKNSRTASWNNERTYTEGGQSPHRQDFQQRHFDTTYSDDAPSQPRAELKIQPTGQSVLNTAKKSPPPIKPKPVLQQSNTLKPNQAVALYSYVPDQDGDLGFKKGDIITIIEKTNSANDWWTGELNGKRGIFPSNYVQTTS